MAKCNQLTPLPFKELTVEALASIALCLLSFDHIARLNSTQLHCGHSAGQFSWVESCDVVSGHGLSWL